MRSRYAGARLTAAGRPDRMRACAASLALLSWLAIAGTASATGWHIEQARAPSIANGQLNAVACPSTLRCTAVGSYTSLTTASFPLIERWSGRAWSIEQPTVTRHVMGELNDVLCIGSRWCIAVGSSTPTTNGMPRTLALTWNGGRWSKTRTIDGSSSRGDALNAVSCTERTACMAVGAVTVTHVYRPPQYLVLAERWNGVRWSRVAVPMPKGATGAALEGVSCASTSDCVAAGSFSLANSGYPSYALLERWNGRTWSVMTSPRAGGAGSGLYSVACRGSRTCIAVGTRTDAVGNRLTLAERLAGGHWSITPTPTVAQSGILAHVSCPAAAACLATATVQLNPLFGAEGAVLAWNGKRWTVAQQINGAGPTPSGVSCAAVNRCTVVGARIDENQVHTTWAERVAGRRWIAERVPNPLGASTGWLWGVSCLTSSSCVAVGTYNGVGGASGPFAAAVAGTRWTPYRPVGSAGVTFGQLNGVSCVSIRACVAAGYLEYAYVGARLPVIVRWDGSKWSSQKVAGVAATANSYLSAVTCPSTVSCLAVGSYQDATGTQAPLIERWRGNGWAREPGPATPAGASLNGVGCPAAQLCFAVGAAGTASPVVDAWNGTTWTSQTVTGPAGGGAVNLRSISCPSATRCVAVGNTGDFQPRGGAVSYVWDGARWTGESLPLPPGTTQALLQTVTCSSPISCVAVGSYTRQAPLFAALVEIWNGAAWRIESVPIPAGAHQSTLEGVSCDRSGRCLAVGFSDAPGTNNLLVERSW